MFGNGRKVILASVCLYFRNSLSLIKEKIERKEKKKKERRKVNKKAPSSNIPHEEASLESRIFPTFVAELKKLMEESIERSSIEPYTVEGWDLGVLG